MTWESSLFLSLSIESPLPHPSLPSFSPSSRSSDVKLYTHLDLPNDPATTISTTTPERTDLSEFSSLLLSAYGCRRSLRSKIIDVCVGSRPTSSCSSSKLFSFFSHLVLRLFVLLQVGLKHLSLRSVFPFRPLSFFPGVCTLFIASSCLLFPLPFCLLR